ncbi:hypothetical protein Dimus_036410 [Dionaea muscipula]
MMRHMAYVVSIKDHESPYGDWMTMIFEAFGVPLVIKREKNLRNMISLKIPSSPCVSLPRENGIWWIGSGENRRRDDDEATQEEEAEGEDEGNRVDFGGRRSLMRQAVEGESGSGRSSMMLEEDARGSPKR